MLTRAYTQGYIEKFAEILLPDGGMGKSIEWTSDQGAPIDSPFRYGNVMAKNLNYGYDRSSEKAFKTLKKIEQLKRNLGNAAPTTIRIGHENRWEDLKWLWTDPELKKKRKLLTRLGWSPLLAWDAITHDPYAPVFDYYHPITDTAVIGSDVPGIAFHEMGHAQDFNTALIPSLKRLPVALGSIPILGDIIGNPLSLPSEWKASKLALQHVKNKRARKALLEKTLAPAFGTYTGTTGAMLGGLSAAAAAVLGGLNLLPREALPALPALGVLGMSLGAGLGYAGGSSLGKNFMINRFQNIQPDELAV